MHVAPESTEEQWDIAGLEAALHDVHVPRQHCRNGEGFPDLDDADIRDRCKTAALDAYSAKRTVAGEDVFSQFERNILLQIMASGGNIFRILTCCARYSSAWLCAKNPEAGIQARIVPRCFRQMLDRFRGDVVRILLTVQVHRGRLRRSNRTRHRKNVAYPTRRC